MHQPANNGPFARFLGLIMTLSTFDTHFVNINTMLYLATMYAIVLTDQSFQPNSRIPFQDLILPFRLPTEKVLALKELKLHLWASFLHPGMR